MEAWPFWLTLLGLLGTLYLSQFFGSHLQDKIRIAGYILQLLGLVTVAAGLENTRRLFKRPSLLAKSVEWVKRLPKVLAPPKTVTGSSEVAFGPIEVLSEGVVEKSPETLEDRLDLLEKKYGQLQQELAEVRQQVKSEAASLKESIDGERVARTAGDEKTRERLEEFSVGGLRLEGVGLIWLAFGITFATIPVEISDFLRR